MEKFLQLYHQTKEKEVSEGFGGKGKDKGKDKEEKLFLVTKPTSKKDTAADVLVTVTPALLFSKFKEGLKVGDVIGVFSNYIEANVAAKGATGEGKKVAESEEDDISEQIKESAGERYAVEASFYVWDKDEKGAVAQATKFASSLDKKHDNNCTIDKIYSAPFGSMKTKLVWEK
jgi:hypothetical protein